MSVILVAENAAEILGAVEVEVTSAPPSSMIRRLPTAWIGLVVDQARRGEGIGRRLLDAAEARARAHGAEAMMLDMSAGNEPARSLYEQLGYLPSSLLFRKPLATTR